MVRRVMGGTETAWGGRLRHNYQDAIGYKAWRGDGA